VTNLALLATIPSAASAGSAQLALWSAVLWTAMIACYGVANLTASVVAARSGGWDLLPYLPAAFATYHFGWGLGFFMGIFKTVAKPVHSLSLGADSTYTRLSR
jgi:hypothetical protein